MITMTGEMALREIHTGMVRNICRKASWLEVVEAHDGRSHIEYKVNEIDGVICIPGEDWQDYVAKPGQEANDQAFIQYVLRVSSLAGPKQWICTPSDMLLAYELGLARVTMRGPAKVIRG